MSRNIYAAQPNRLNDPGYMSRKIRKFRRINSIRETNGNFDSCNSCKRLVPSRLHELHESKFPFVSRIEFIRSKLSNFSAHVYGVTIYRETFPIEDSLPLGTQSHSLIRSPPGGGCGARLDHC